MARATLRLRAVQIGFVVGALVLVGRALQVQLARGAAYERRAQAQRTERVTLPAARGTIYDRNRVPLSLTQESFHVGVDPDEVRDTAATIALLATHLALTRDHIRTTLRREYAYFHGPFTSRQVQALRGRRGIYLNSESERFYPNPNFARAVLGRTAAPGRPASGIERVFDSLLTGRDGSAVVLRDQFGRRYASPSRLDAFPVPGHDVVLTLDAELQEIVEGSLAEAVDRLEAAGGDVVIIAPRTGELLAVAALRADGSAPASPFTSVFEPGSTAKLFAAAALLNHGLARPADSVWGENGVWNLGSRVIEDEHPEGWMTLRQVIGRSSNIGIAKFAARLTAEQHYTGLRAFGLGTPTGVEYPAESGGLFAPPARWSSTTAASLAIGYEVAVTMMQLAAAYSAIANDGVLMQPTLVRRVVDAAGREVYRHRPFPVRRVMEPTVARELRAMLRGVVEGDGTGSTAALVNYELAGKTGTARRAGPGGYVPGSHIANFASMFPADDPQLVMVVKLDDPAGTYARGTAAPLTRSVLEQVLAAQTDVLDPARLHAATAPPPPPTLTPGVVPYVMDWPADPPPPDTSTRRIPDVRRLGVRAAVNRLHREGLRVRLVGSGPVDSLAPAPGTRVGPGTVVTVFARVP